MTMKNSNIKKDSGYKHWLTVGLVAAALTLSACGKKDEAPMEAESPVDAQTAVEDEASGVATAGDSGVATADDSGVATAGDDVAVASANDAVVVDTNDAVAVATADDSEVLDGTEDSEHVSTY